MIQVTLLIVKLEYNHGHNILELFSLFLQYNWPQVKQNSISSMRNFLYEMLHKFPRNLDLRSQEIRKFQKNLKLKWRHSLVLSIPLRNSTLVIAAKKTRRRRFQNFLVLSKFILYLFCFKNVVKDCQNKHIQNINRSSLLQTSFPFTFSLTSKNFCCL